MDNVRRIPQHGNLRSATTLELVELLKDGKPGDIINDDEVVRLIGKGIAVGESAYQPFHTANRYVVEHFKVFWKRVPGKRCIKCYEAAEMLGETKAGLKSIRRKARRTATLSASIDRSKLSPEESKEALSLTAQLGCVAAFATSNVTKKLDVADTPIVPDVNAIAKLFAPKSNP